MTVLLFYSFSSFSWYSRYLPIPDCYYSECCLFGWYRPFPLSIHWHSMIGDYRPFYHSNAIPFHWWFIVDPDCSLFWWLILSILCWPTDWWRYDDGIYIDDDRYITIVSCYLFIDDFCSMIYDPFIWFIDILLFWCHCHSITGGCYSIVGDAITIPR